MGQGQSSAENAEESDPPLKRDYYELLDVERTATEDEIKKAYRRKALELHPDRNYGNEEGATRLFSEISAAYEVLADPQERAWYDSHRDVLLRGDTGKEEGEEYSYNIRMTTADEVLKLMMRFNKRTEFNDAPSGFYGGLNEFFQKIAKEEDIACQWQDLDCPEYPEFGSKDDDYDDVVRPFYGAWTGFATKKSYSWKDKYRLSDAPDRRIRRLMEKENQKFREEAIQEFNDAIRSLIAFVRKRDPRVQNNQKTEAERQKILRDAAAAQAARSRAQRQKQMEQYDNASIPEWAQSRSKDVHEGGFSSDSDEEEHEYECVVCDKTFKSEAQLNAHEKSKKHIKLLKDFKRDMRKEGKDFDLNANKSSQQTKKKPPAAELDEVESETIESRPSDVLSDDDSNSTTSHSGSEDADDKDETPTSKDDKDRPDSQHTSEDDENDEYASRAAVEGRLSGKDVEGVGKQFQQANLEDTPATSGTESGAQPKVGKAKQKRAKKAQKAVQKDTSVGSSELQCAICKAEFPSRTKLFEHIKKTKHAALKTQITSNKTSRGKK